MLAVFTVLVITICNVNLPAIKNKDHMYELRSMLRGCVFLLPLIGVPWLFGIMSFTEEAAFLIIYVLFNSLQGFFMFLFLGLGSPQFRAIICTCRKDEEAEKAEDDLSVTDSTIDSRRYSASSSEAPASKRTFPRSHQN
ncbi:PREDICTED: adhesion G-protein coupled receptor G2-like, partial [Priapulus caudatus]|uniref:Adhesion G-protein coupled receptor G2-like n=1 Tax=Priapulus caudatus TaxID=37621 RepID=A0ABM1F0U3_PRICU